MTGYEGQEIMTDKLFLRYTASVQGQWVWNLQYFTSFLVCLTNYVMGFTANYLDLSSGGKIDPVCISADGYQVKMQYENRFFPVSNFIRFHFYPFTRLNGWMGWEGGGRIGRQTNIL